MQDARDRAPAALEHPPELEEPFVMPGVAHAAAHEKRPDDRLCQDAGGNVIREFAFVRRAVHFCEFVRGITKSFSTSGGSVTVMQITCPNKWH